MYPFISWQRIQSGMVAYRTKARRIMRSKPMRVLSRLAWLLLGGSVRHFVMDKLRSLWDAILDMDFPIFPF